MSPKPTSVVLGSRDPHDPADMLIVARAALVGWRESPAGSAAERKNSRLLAFAFGRLDDLGALNHISPDPHRISP